MDRRKFLVMTGTGVAAAGLVSSVPTTVSAQAGRSDLAALDAALKRFRQLPGDVSYLVEVGRSANAWRAAHRPDAPMFMASAIKTFVLATFLQDQEAGRLSENDPLAVDNAVRTLGSPVFGGLRGTTPARSALEAMIAHSDNTGTDMVMAKVGPDRIRALIARAGLTSVRIPDSTRILNSFLAGAPFGTDAGWAGMKKVLAGELLGPRARNPINDRVTMMGTASDFVSWYRRSLRGAFFDKPETLVEYKRISAQASSLARVVPADTPAYGKGGSLDWEGFHALTLPGQMVLGGVLPVTFSFTVNWTGPDAGVPQVMRDYAGALSDVLAGVKDVFG